MTIPRKVTYLQFLWDVSKFCYELVRENEQRYAKYEFGGLWWSFPSPLDQLASKTTIFK